MWSAFIRFGAWFSRLVAGSSPATQAAIGIAAGEGAVITAQNLWSWITGNSEEDSQGGVVNTAIDMGNDLTDALRKNLGLVGLLLAIIMFLSLRKQIMSIVR